MNEHTPTTLRDLVADRLAAVSVSFVRAFYFYYFSWGRGPGLARVGCSAEQKL